MTSQLLQDRIPSHTLLQRNTKTSKALANHKARSLHENRTGCRLVWFGWFVHVTAPPSTDRNEKLNCNLGVMREHLSLSLSVTSVGGVEPHSSRSSNSGPAALSMPRARCQGQRRKTSTLA